MGYLTWTPSPSPTLPLTGRGKNHRALRTQLPGACVESRLQQLRHRIQSDAHDSAHDHAVDPDVLQIAADLQLGFCGHILSIPPAHDFLDEQRDLVAIA